MALTLYFHPLSSFCWKALIALYENDTPFAPYIVDLMDEAESAAFKKIWPIGEFPVLRDEAANRTIPESTTIIEYLAQHHPGPSRLVPEDADLARDARFKDRYYDLHVQAHMQKIVLDRLRPAGSKDALGVEQAKARLAIALAMIDEEMAERTWAVGEDFTLADCAAAPALYYANLVVPFTGTHKSAARYLERLSERPSFARVLRDAEPYRHLFPQA